MPSANNIDHFSLAGQVFLLSRITHEFTVSRLTKYDSNERITITIRGFFNGFV